MFWRKKFYGLLFLSFALWVAGCNQITGKAAEHLPDHSGGDVRFEAQSVGSDILLRPAYDMYTDDLRLIKQAARQIRGVRDSAILINGPDAYVNLEFDPRMKPEDSMRIRNQAQASLQRMFPRFNVRVSAGGTNRLLHPYGP